MAVTDNIADAGSESLWDQVTLDRRFDRNSKARLLDRPAFLREVAIGYFGDAVIVRQYSASQLTTIHADSAGFIAELDWWSHIAIALATVPSVMLAAAIRRVGGRRSTPPLTLPDPACRASWSESWSEAR